MLRKIKTGKDEGPIVDLCIKEICGLEFVKPVQIC